MFFFFCFVQRLQIFTISFLTDFFLHLCGLNFFIPLDFFVAKDRELYNLFSIYDVFGLILFEQRAH